MIDANKKGVVEDVATMRVLNCDSDYFIVRIMIKQKLIRTHVKATKQIKWDQRNVEDSAMLK
jgi:hypothetical protein